MYKQTLKNYHTKYMRVPGPLIPTNKQFISTNKCITPRLKTTRHLTQNKLTPLPHTPYPQYPLPPTQGGFYNKAYNVLASLSILFPYRLKVVDHKHSSRDEYRSWLIGDAPGSGFRDTFGLPKASKQTSSPFAWIETPSGSNSYIGGCDDTLAWCKSLCEPREEEETERAVHEDDGHKAGHGFDYDLVVIGGGSGGELGGEGGGGGGGATVL